ncbi:hypothetical protein [Nocardia abscessus]|uniref:hypothetical protein n=1 Tax=Nocardia abscessus TaxID=120957 RepID=UPI002456FC60|nr:hypothetical protein [Nocardia abscessus]
MSPRRSATSTWSWTPSATTHPRTAHPAPGRLLVSLRAFGPVDLAAEAQARGVRAVRMLVEHDHAGMRALAALAESGTLRPTLAGTFPRCRRRRWRMLWVTPGEPSAN